MEYLKIALFLLGGGVTLSWGAGLFVSSSSSFATRFGIPPVIIGLTVVSFGTSAPELAVNLIAALQGNPDIAIGNVVGSNIFNIAFILGLCAIIKPLLVSSQLIRIDIPIMVLSTLGLWSMSQNLVITRLEGSFLLLGVASYTLLQIKLALKSQSNGDEHQEGLASKAQTGKDILKLVIGLVLLIVGAKYFVDGAVISARLFGLSEAVIGLTIIAAGTSLPEVATSVAATLKGERDIAIGNVVGSNIFNILGVIGVTSVVSSNGIPVNTHMASVDTVVMVFVAFLCLPFTVWRKQLDRWLGICFFGIWLLYTIYLIHNP